jgi:hypothetical protein
MASRRLTTHKICAYPANGRQRLAWPTCHPSRYWVSSLFLIYFSVRKQARAPALGVDWRGRSQLKSLAAKAFNLPSRKCRWPLCGHFKPHGPRRLELASGHRSTDLYATHANLRLVLWQSKGRRCILCKPSRCASSRGYTIEIM